MLRLTSFDVEQSARLCFEEGTHMSIENPAEPTTTSSLNTEGAATAPEKKKGHTKRIRMVVGFAGLAALAGAGAGVKALTSGGDHNPPVTETTNQPTNSQTSETSPAEVRTGKYGPTAAEAKQFEASIQMPISLDASALGEQYVKTISAIKNIGENEGASGAFNEDITLSIDTFPGEFVGDWKNEFITIFDKNSPDYNKLVSSYAGGAEAYTKYYLQTVENRNANVAFHESLTFIDATEETPVDCDRQLLITYHVNSNMGDTGVSTMSNVNTDTVVRVKFTNNNGNLEISSIEQVR